MKKRFLIWILCLIVGTVGLAAGATESDAYWHGDYYDVVIKDADDWSIGFNYYPVGYYTMNLYGEIKCPDISGGTCTRQAFGWYFYDTDQLVILANTLGGCEWYDIFYRIQFVGDTPHLSGTYSYFAFGYDYNFEKTVKISAELIKGRLGNHFAEGASPAETQETTPSGSSGETTPSALLHPSAGGISLALNGSSFRMGDTLETHLRVDAALLPEGAADLWSG